MKSILSSKRGITDLSEFAIGIVILGIVVSIGATVLINVRDTNTANSTPYNLSDKAATGLGEYGNWFKILVIVAIAGAILSIIFASFRFRGAAGGATY